MLKLITAPNPVLSKKTDFYNFKNGDVSLGPLLRDMEGALLAASDPKGVGLAAPQVGKPVRIFMAKPTEKSKITVFINPEIIEIDNSPREDSEKPKSKKLSKATRLAEAKAKRESASGGLRKLEGCLSLPNIWGEVERAPWVIIKYQTPQGKTQTKKFSGFMATIVQHEIDHLEGILFPKRVLEQNGRLYKSHKDEKGKDVFEELTI